MKKWEEISKLQNRAGLWSTRSIQASSKGEYDKAGRLRTKAMELLSKAESMRKELLKDTNNLK